ncbi:MAG: hypothetical protein M1818_007664 [Claussenomyces sp. TS43310]|nr:MAG: hypothetical protein M1818_007664 [Claussenomyces sp. TS43310]
MLAQRFTNAARPASRAFATTSRVMAAGDTGSVRAGGVASSDSFNKREKANEDLTIRKREQEKLLELKKKLADQHEHLKKLEASIDQITKDQAEGK